MSDTNLSIVYITYYVAPIVKQTQVMMMDFDSSIIIMMYDNLYYEFLINFTVIVGIFISE